MKLTLYQKFILGYLIFGISAFILVSTFSSHFVHTYLISENADSLYNEAVNLAEDSAQYYTENMVELNTLSPQLSTLASWIKADLWIIDKKGNIIYDSCNEHNQKTLKNFNVTKCTTNGYYTTGTFYGNYSKDVLSVLAPITVQYSVRGYIILHMSLKIILEEQYSLLNLIYITAALILILSLILLIVFHFVVYVPIKKISIATKQYAAGNLKYQCNVYSSDELGDLSGTLNYMAAELANSEEYQKKFISNISHDFRSPLTSIKGYLVAILDGTIPTERQEKYLKIIINETERLSKLTQGLLTLNKLDGQDRQLNLTAFDINHIIRDTCATFEGNCKKREITIDLTFSSQQLIVYADMLKIQQVIYNLMDNAIKFSHNHSIICIETYDKNEKAFISIKDSGMGIAKENIKKIWERFYKVDSSRGKDKKGTGLGLAITRDIIHAHQQNIDVISTEGIGTEFIFTLQKKKA